MGAIVEFVAGDLAFDQSAIEAMSAALDHVCEALNIIGSASAREVIAIRIIELARQGERTAAKLQEALLTEAQGGSGC
jgi:hypothetical protein